MTFYVRLDGVYVGTVVASDIEEAMELALKKFESQWSRVISVESYRTKGDT